jgi:hypothetical protein
MQVEQPHHAPSSAREFIKQYAMIVLSILTALGLEQFAVSIQNRFDAAASRARIEAELARNAQDLKDSEALNQKTNQAATALLHALGDHLKAAKPIDAEVEALMTPVFAHFEISEPTFQHSAWEAAIADHSSTHLPAADLGRYSEIYAAAADAQSSWQLLLGGEWLTRATELGLDFRLGTVEARNLANVLARFLVAAQQIEASEEQLSDLIAGQHKPVEETVTLPH